ncbi:MAG: sterol desaturase family protein [Bacteroidetes bacterium]|nr:sterol desaturase family protein [Bacteroidota bacterium]
MNFNSLSQFIPAIVFIVIFLFLLSLEHFFPLRNKTYSLVVRLLINASLSVISFMVVFFLVSPAAKNAISWSSENSFGILNLIKLPAVIEGIIAFLLMDLAFYYWHLANHKVPVFWRFHNVHHIDPDLDVSTAFRFHFGEIALSAIFRIIQISIIGITPAAFFIYEICFTANTIFQHSNVKLPIRFERILNKIIVTPRMHAIHHSQFRTETDSNFSTVFSLWDHLHKSIRLNIPHKDIVIGVPGYTKSGDNNLDNVLLLPFKKQRDYWKKPDGSELFSREKYISENPGKLED